jgi:hypothetical protein
MAILLALTLCEDNPWGDDGVPRFRRSLLR